MLLRKGNPVHGWVILDKPEGVTSSRAVGIVRRVFQAAKAGHGGTLGPLATGVLPIAVGEATKTTSFAMQGSKRYSFTLAFGAQTQTDDREGEIIHESDVRPGRDAATRSRHTGRVNRLGGGKTGRASQFQQDSAPVTAPVGTRRDPSGPQQNGPIGRAGRDRSDWS